jgi:hypothetical protein
MIGLLKAKACNRDVAGFFVLFTQRPLRSRERKVYNYPAASASLFSLREILFLPSKQFIQLIFFKFQVSRFTICCAVGYGAVKQVFNQHLHFFIG